MAIPPSGSPPTLSIPGVYVSEVRPGIGPIAAVPTGSVALVGSTSRGPTGRPLRVRSFAEFIEAFGRARTRHPTSLAAQLFFANGGREALVVRVATPAKRDAPRPRDVVGESDGRSGLRALAGRDDFELVLTPDAERLSPAAASRVAAAALELCERQNAFHLLEVPSGGLRRLTPEAAIERVTASPAAGSGFAASYFPRVEIADPGGGSEPVLVSPNGAMAGLYARTDASRGVWKAPAGTAARLLAIRDLELELDEQQAARLLGGSINALRGFPGRGFLCWGARTLAGGSSSEWRYVAVRRLASMVERSLRAGLSWTVFEPNAPALWAQVRLAASSFMHMLFRAGALEGASLREAYFVSCGLGATMTQTDLDQGRMVLEVGFAPLVPAEFVVVRIGLKTQTP